MNTVFNESAGSSIKQPTYCCMALLESCFLKCRMCYKGRADVRLRDPQEPTLEEWSNFIVSLRRLVKGKFQINFAGGEPLIREETLKLTRHAADLKFDVLLATNAVLIDEDTAKRIADSGVTAVNISLDSLKEDRHDYIRGVNGVYRKVMRAIELIDRYASGVKIGICTVIMNENIDELGEIVKWIQANDKIDGMGFQAVTQPFSTPEDHFWYHNAEYSHLWPGDISKVDTAMDKLIAMKNSGFDKLGNPVSQFNVYKAYFRNPNKFIKKQKCHLDMQAVNITPSGEIRICFYMESIGNVKSDDINDVWFSEKAEILRAKVTNCNRNCQSMVNCNFDESEIYIS